MTQETATIVIRCILAFIGGSVLASVFMATVGLFTMTAGLLITTILLVCWLVALVVWFLWG